MCSVFQCFKHVPAELGLRFTCFEFSAASTSVQALDRSRKQPPATMALGPHSPYTVLTVPGNRTHKNKKETDMTISCAPWQYMTISYYFSLSHISFIFLYLFYVSLCFVWSFSPHDLKTVRTCINFADLTPRRHWGWFARLCRSDLHLGPQPFQGTGPQHTKIQRLRMLSTSQYSISPV